MAQRTDRSSLLSLSSMAAPPSGSGFPREPEESQPVPTCPRHLAGNGAQGAIASPLMLEAFQQNFHRDGLATEGSAQEGTRRWDAPVVSGPQSAPSVACPHLRECLLHPGRRPDTQIGLVCDRIDTLEGSFRQSPFGQGLQAPGHAAEQLILVFGARLFAEQLAVLLAQAAQRRLAQFFDFSESGCIHVLFPLLGRCLSPAPT